MADNFKIKILPDIIDWIKLSKPTEEGDGVIPTQLEIPVLKNGEEVAKAKVSPIIDPETGTVSIHLDISW